MARSLLSANDMEKQVVIGTIIAPHGVRGDIRILPQTDHPEQFLELSSLLLEDGRSLQITSAQSPINSSSVIAA